MDIKAAAGQFTGLWSALSIRQRVSIGVAVIAVVAGLFAFSTWHREKDFKPLFSEMNAEDGGAVVAKLKESGTEYRVTGNGSTILVPSLKVAEARLQLASAGIPRTGRIGFELFDKTSFGTTDFAEQVNYRRALEGELERSIRSISDVEQARIHLTFPKDSVFLESRLPSKASVLLRLKAGAKLPPSNVQAIVYLVASAVEGLVPEMVSITDSNGHLLNRPKKTLDPDGASDESIEYRQKLERDLTAKVNSTLEPLVGAGKYRIGMSVDCDFSSGEQSEETYDPEKSVMLSTQKTEESSGSASSGGVPGTASALPRPAPRTGSGGTGGLSRRTENVTYQTSRTVRRTRLPQGSIRRISASVLLDQNVRWELRDGKQQRVLVPPSAESVKAIHDVVSAAVGLLPSRGDQLVIESLPFESTLELAPPPVPANGKQPAPSKKDNVLALDWRDWRVMVGAGGALLVLFALVMLMKRMFKRKPKVAITQSVDTGARQGVVAGAETPAGEATASTGRYLQQAQDQAGQSARMNKLLEDIRTTIDADPSLAANVMRTWLTEDEK
ncbi:MAG: flagellar M-ring protein FliF [Bryobacteraceae bacterium]|nr:flagellar M-ring protein FliF [Bryobacteraceae bacterium]